MRPRSGKRVDETSSALGLLGLARRAGAVAPGVEAARRAVDAGAARLLLIAEDASGTQLDKVRAPAERRGVLVRSLGTRNDLGRAVGGPPLSAVAVTNEGFAEQMLRRLDGPDALNEPK